MDIAIDLGNTFAKVGWFDGERLIATENKVLFQDLGHVLGRYPIDQIVFSSVSYTAEEFQESLPFQVSVLNFDRSVPIPLKVDYETPQTLGVDRVAAAVGATVCFPNESLMVIDSGSCITYDLVAPCDVFQGGAIAPGLWMRYRAMHEFTKRLPLVESLGADNLVGKNTLSAMKSGVEFGMTAEIQGMITAFCNKYGELKVVMCGGDADFFESRLNSPIFVVPELVLIGLNRILQYNAPKKQK